MDHRSERARDARELDWQSATALAPSTGEFVQAAAPASRTSLPIIPHRVQTHAPAQ